MKLFILIFSFITIITFALSIYFIFHKYKNNATEKEKDKSIIIITLILLSVCSYLLTISLDQTNDLLILPVDKIKDYSKIGAYGDLIGGLMNPVIAFIGIIAALLAFYAQYRANQQVQEQFKVQQFESQFYERLNLVKEEINDVYLPLLTGDTLVGRKVFYELDKEIKFIFFIVTNLLNDKSTEIKFCITYKIFYMGRKEFFKNKNLLHISEKYNIRKKVLLELDDILSSIYEYFINNTAEVDNLSSNIEDNLDKKISDFLEKLDDVKYDELFKDLLINERSNNYHYSYLIFKDKYGIKFNHVPFKGMETKLSLIIRQIFSLVKYVTNGNFLNYQEKRNYLRVLRSILSNYEQLHIFYNWYSGTGSEWESNENKFLTDYRIIHNLPPNFLIEGINLEDIFRNKDLNFAFEVNRKFEDSLFEQIDIFSTRPC